MLIITRTNCGELCVKRISSVCLTEIWLTTLRRDVPCCVSAWCHTVSSGLCLYVWAIPLLATWRRRRPAFRRPTFSLDSAKSSGAVTGKRGGSLFERFSSRSDAPCAGCEGAERQAGCASAEGSADEWELSAQLLSSPAAAAAAAAAAGVCFRIFFLWQ